MIILLISLVFMLSSVNVSANPSEIVPKITDIPYVELGISWDFHRAFMWWGSEIVLKANFEGFEAGKPRSVTKYYIAKLKANKFAVAPEALTVTGVDVEFVPLTTVTQRQNGLSGIQILPFKVTRDVHINESFGMRVEAVGFNRSWNGPVDEKGWSFLAALSVKALGFKLRKYTEEIYDPETQEPLPLDRDTYRGFTIGEFTAEIGKRFRASEKFSMVFLIGTQDLLSFGQSGRTGVQADLMIYAKMIFEIIERFEFVVGGDFRTVFDSGNDAFDFDFTAYAAFQTRLGKR